MAVFVIKAGLETCATKNVKETVQEDIAILSKRRNVAHVRRDTPAIQTAWRKKQTGGSFLAEAYNKKKGRKNLQKKRHH